MQRRVLSQKLVQAALNAMSDALGSCGASGALGLAFEFESGERTGGAPVSGSVRSREAVMSTC
ncbi:hypothetical protein D7252_16505 [Microbacterium sp. CGR2]|nr:hypothetical protein D7252_16505 [Microbacterium sp. CGR2]